MTAARLLGLLTGFLFGFLLQKGRVLRFEKQLGALLLRDMTIFKFMLSAIMVGAVGIHLLEGAGVVSFSHKTLDIAPLLLGGALFGVGWALAGFCPGTALGALGEGRWHALGVIAGMVAGAALYAEAFPLLQQQLIGWRDFGRIGLPGLLPLPPWPIIAIFWGLCLLLFVFFERRKL